MSERMEDDWTVARADSATGASGIGRGAGASDADGGTPADPAEIRAEIRETRERLGDTLEELGDRLNPRHVRAQITEQVKENVREATIGRVQHMANSAADRVQDTRNTIMDAVRENPIPAAMAAIGLGWLFVNARKQTGGRSYGVGTSGYLGRPAYGGQAYGEYPGYPYGSGAAGFADQRYASGGEQGGVIDSARERVSQVGHQVQDAAGSVAHRAQDVAGDVADRAQEAASRVAQQTRYQARRVEDRFYESPLAVGAATLALGLATGLAIPASDREVALMGDARDRLVDRAKEVAHETTEKVQHVAERVIDETKSTGAQAARDEGLTR